MQHLKIEFNLQQPQQRLAPISLYILSKLVEATCKEMFPKDKANVSTTKASSNLTSMELP